MQPATDEFRPFCSERCKMADLGRWLGGDYAVPAVDAPTLEGLTPEDIEAISGISEDEE